MLYSYCASCGGKTEYSLVKPSFCSNCGKDFSDLVRIQSQPAPTPVPKKTAKPAKSLRQTRRDTDENETIAEEFVQLPEVKKIELEVKGLKPVFEKIGQVMGSEGIPISREVSKNDKKASQILRDSCAPTKKSEEVE